MVFENCCEVNEVPSGLSCISQDFVRHFDPEVTVLSKYDFTVPGMGLKPGYCGKPHVNGLYADGTGAHVIFTHCKKHQCPDCNDLWRLQKVFTNTVKIEAYSRYCGQRPCKGMYSFSPDQEYTLKCIRKNREAAIKRLRRQGVEAGITVFHGFRILKKLKPLLTKLTGTKLSSGHWNYILNEENISEINKHLKYEARSWYDLVSLGIHEHFIVFPGNIILKGDKKGKIVIEKESYSDKDAGIKIWELQDVEAVFTNVMYLSSHVSQLDNGSKNHIKPYLPIGELYNKKLLDLVSPEELQEIRLNVLELINRRRTQKFDIKDGELVYASDPENKVDIIPMSDLRYRSKYGQENAINHINYVKQVCPENAVYSTYLIRTYNDLMYSRDVPFKYKRLFLEPIASDSENMPYFVKNMYDLSPVKQMFQEGLKAPPETFTFYFNKHLNKKEQQYQDRLKAGNKVVNDAIPKPEIIKLEKEQLVTNQVVKPEINKDDPVFIASIEKKFLKLCSGSINQNDIL